APASATGPSEYQVRPGDTLSRVANRTKPAGISLDQMLVGLFRNNPDAFVGENMNRLRSGVVLQVPGSDSLGAVSTDEARQVIQAQSADFSAYRQRLAGGAPELRQDAGQRQAKGQVQAAVEDRKPAAAPSPDKLTLSKAGAAAASEAKLSKDTEKKADAARVAELTRNVEELKKLSSETKPGSAAPTAGASAAVAAASVPAAVAPTSPAVVAPVPVASAPAPRPAPPTPAPQAEEPGLLSGLMDNPLVLPIAGVLVALLAGVGLMRLRGKKGFGSPKADTGFHESRLQPDSFFGASGGQRVDTRDASNGGASSMSYSLSQLDAIGDVDPVAEADVYLAYGRDLQAEEILKEALRATPERLAIRLKLLEVYAKRRDIKGFEQLAIQLFAETQGQGEDWAKAQELGRQIDADNPLYQPGGAPALLNDRVAQAEPMNANTMPQTAQQSLASGAHLSTEPLNRAAVARDAGPVSGLGGLDLDLDLGTPAPAPAVSPFAMEATQALATTVEQAPLAMDFDLDSPPAGLPPVAPGEDQTLDLGDLAFDLDDVPPSAERHTDSAPLTVEGGQAAPLDFDLSTIDLDLPPADGDVEEPIPTASASVLDDNLAADFDSLLQDEQGTDPLAKAFDALEGDDAADPLQRQLELADEFRQIGDTEGARDVLQELLARASGPMRDKVQAMLKELG
ncbi:MAG TPA: FimV/HubP family polar landmark protein, partial [Roseateles sp.]|nr:FimV/HubP family polar landmark protein [Roseateles sp.]